MPWGLIVEPHAVSSSKFSALFADVGLEPIVAKDGAAAKALLLQRTEAPRVVLTELSLAGIDGFQLIRELRQSTPQAHILVVSSFVKLRNAALDQKQQFNIEAVFAKYSPLESIRRTLYRVLGIKRPEALPALTLEAALPAPPELPLLPLLETQLLPTEPPPRPPAAAPALSQREQVRLAKIAQMNLVDDEAPEELLQSLVQETARTFNVPIALLSLVLKDRQWFKAHVGLTGKLREERGTEREAALCAHVVEADAAEPLVVPDAATHPVFSSNRLVREGVFRSYAGAPLITREGTVLGTLCILDHKPLAISAEQVAGLVALARRVAGELDLRAQLRKSQRALSQERDAHVAVRLQADVLAAALNGLEDGVLLFDHRRVILFANEYMALLADQSVPQLTGMHRDAFIRTFSARFKDPADFLQRVLIPAEGPYVGREDFELTCFPRRIIRWTSRPVAFPDGNFGQFTLYRDVTNEIEFAPVRTFRESGGAKEG
ncbi:DNA-binding response regulator, NarL/FixJ family, contains REC and HTH domains [Stigmatella aurantiaca]|uniref:DNA-binding response regulator, NarL/FixJ family, contains REC and HTH domains n=1 Tax=Stigmatella aurantiaca TaxID=41 RepID=A0A1H7H345_STIAU|nr:GAF domain-containing protein [Stigmatella aurantiaca]SEK44719.1 DNA-binding response regulator, NarL/FixJ family, contains REC and HTH domains [Stigmatella aurantiaca]